MSFEKTLLRLQEQCNRRLTEVLIYPRMPEGEFSEMLRYGVLNGGKRLRPILLIKTFELFDCRQELAMPYALAIELIHNYSLIHDDLPAMDDDDYRRGRYTVHKKYGEAMAILAGDALLNLAYEEIALAMQKFPENMERQINAFAILSQKAGYRGMIGGQVLDIHQNMHCYKDLMEIYEKKTAALIQSAVLCGAVLGGASQEEYRNLEKFSYHLGIAFQLQDDLLDIHEVNEPNAILFLSKEKVKEEIQKHTEKAINYLCTLENKDISFLFELTNYLINRRK